MLCWIFFANYIYDVIVGSHWQHSGFSHFIVGRFPSPVVLAVGSFVDLVPPSVEDHNVEGKVAEFCTGNGEQMVDNVTVGRYSFTYFDIIDAARDTIAVGGNVIVGIICTFAPVEL